MGIHTLLRALYTCIGGNSGNSILRKMRGWSNVQRHTLVKKPFYWGDFYRRIAAAVGLMPLFCYGTGRQFSFRCNVMDVNQLSFGFSWWMDGMGWDGVRLTEIVILCSGIDFDLEYFL